MDRSLAALLTLVMGVRELGDQSPEVLELLLTSCLIDVRVKCELLRMMLK